MGRVRQVLDYASPLTFSHRPSCVHPHRSAVDFHLNSLEPIIADREPVTSDLALRLAKCFRTSPQFWLGLQNAYDLGMAEARYGAEIEERVHALAA